MPIDYESSQYLEPVLPSKDIYEKTVDLWTLPADFSEKLRERFEKLKGEDPEKELNKIILSACGQLIFESIEVQGLLEPFDGIFDQRIRKTIKNMLDAALATFPARNVELVPEDFYKHVILPRKELFLLPITTRLKDLYEMKALMNDSNKVVEAAVSDVRNEMRIALRESLIDNLTGLGGRHLMEEKMQSISNGPLRDYWVLMLDVDHFKSVNDSWGHKTGDAVLKAVGQLIQDCTPEDSAFRYGGEEFIVMVDAEKWSEKDVTKMAERIRGEFERLTFKTLSEGEEFSRTISIGVSKGHSSDIHRDTAYSRASEAINVGDPTNLDLIGKADMALYKAKRGGRNQVVFFDADQEFVRAEKSNI